jgi:MYXO-CTERM domain-containing protein
MGIVNQSRSLSPRARLPRRAIGFIVALVCTCLAGAAESVLRTENASGLQTVTVPVLTPDASLEPFLSFDFAFATSEAAAPGGFLDSVTFSMQGTNPSSLALVLTLDASGLALAPNNPGGLALNPGSVQATAIDYFGSAGDPLNRAAYSIRMNLPAELASQPASFYFDLFNNGDGLHSVGYFRNFAVVPEPGAGWLVVVGLAAAVALRRRSH